MAGGIVGGSAHIIVRGRAELEKAFLELRREVLREIKPALLTAAEPARRDAETIARENISNLGYPWSQMRIGATPRGVYIAPKSKRRRGSRRPNLAPLLAKSMQQAADQNQEKVVKAISVAVDVAAARTGFH